MFGAVLMSHTSEEADLGAIFMDPSGYLHMWGHATIAIGTVAIETGLISASGTTPIVLETPAGLVRLQAKVTEGQVESVTFRNGPSFLYGDRELEVPGVGRIPVEVAFGGNFFALVEVSHLGAKLHTLPLKELVALGMSILEVAQREVVVQHPTEPHINSIELVELRDPLGRAGVHSRNLVVWGEGQFDRSPCGSGTSAFMAALHAKGELSLGQQLITQSMVGTRFYSRIAEETTVGCFTAIVPEVTGSAFIIGLNQWVVAPRDPLKHGFMAS